MFTCSAYSAPRTLNEPVGSSVSSFRYTFCLESPSDFAVISRVRGRCPAKNSRASTNRARSILSLLVPLLRRPASRDTSGRTPVHCAAGPGPGRDARGSNLESLLPMPSSNSPSLRAFSSASHRDKPRCTKSMLHPHATLRIGSIPLTRRPLAPAPHNPFPAIFAPGRLLGHVSNDFPAPLPAAATSSCTLLFFPSPQASSPAARRCCSPRRSLPARLPSRPLPLDNGRLKTALDTASNTHLRNPSFARSPCAPCVLLHRAAPSRTTPTPG